MKHFSITELVEQIRSKQSFLCIGLDTDLDKIPKHLLAEKDPIFEFNKAIIDATHHLVVAYKPNTAFYEAMGTKGWVVLEKTIDYINRAYPDIFTIADAKRGDIGNTSAMYAKAFFDDLQFDSVTVAPYMGKDSVEPFLRYPNKVTILLALTSNQGAFDFQTQPVANQALYKKVLETSQKWEGSQQLMYVVGATKAQYLKEIRQIVPDNFLLIPGIGAQGGSLTEVCQWGLTQEVGLLVNASRSVLYASSELDFAQKATNEALQIQQQMKEILIQHHLV
ncbi:orotidine-5'-phosphate decarboxylase [Capnocytophaga catalasegens]|uniref:Orotidine 5'-phosphate decarboxylase n=1 Tax=Capnocytophaga catalasegens TaxID=1004260 RepID=A0AAV5ATX3_9FLAO|nr:orotidine-5'-phosphate decarboxylase [Capnocytophaga catalasegens]GIZ14602.1 orotidine 5'-phosphate decarboxylase [Capnocytophaga catalasegens]GJM50804.1 orotidine 5'-phosphate decarboxylase [Capnocytophaga catalasegens]GJM51957.1 orotidine 5'-phosphate decarboxylase [Capnocytophaga catalasegens]